MWALSQELLRAGQGLDQRVIIIPFWPEDHKSTVLPKTFKTDYLCPFVSREVDPTRDKADFTTEWAKNCTNWLPPANLALYIANKLTTASVEGKKNISTLPNLSEGHAWAEVQPMGFGCLRCDLSVYVCPCRVNQCLSPSLEPREGGCNRLALQ